MSTRRHALIPATGDAPSRMPDFCRPRRGARHTVDTALRSLHCLGLPDGAIVVESAGPGWPAGTVVRQEPQAGELLDGRTRVVLTVAGIGALESLPYALRDVDQSDFGVDPFMGLFDNPVSKLRHHLRSGSEFFALRADDPVSARRWIEHVFQLDPTRWRPARWPALARLLPALHHVAGGLDGLELALRLVCALPLASVEVRRTLVPVASDGRLGLGMANVRLGVDTVLGEGLAETARLFVTLGPVPLDVYLAHAAEADRSERRSLYALVLPMHLARAVDEHWIVGDPHCPTRLADAGHRAIRDVHTLSAGTPALGLTTRLGPLPGVAPGGRPDAR